MLTISYKKDHTRMLFLLSSELIYMIVVLAHKIRQIKNLNNFDILPLKFRYFKRLTKFLFMNITKNPTLSLVES